MDCIPFVRRISNLRHQFAIKPDTSPSEIGRKAFTRQTSAESRRQNINRKQRNSVTGSNASSDSAESSVYSSESSLSHSTDSERGYEEADINRQHQQRIGPSVSYSDKMSQSCDQSTLFSLSNETDITITLARDDFLGISIVGQNFSNGDCNLFVGAVVPGGAVSRDGRIQPGDIILAVNGESLEGKSNKQAVALLRYAVQSHRDVTLTIVGSWDDESVFSEGTVIQPIDPLLWLNHNSRLDQQDERDTPEPSPYAKGHRLRSQASLSSSLSSSMPSTTARVRSRYHQQALPLETPTDIVANRLRLHIISRNNNRQYGINAESSPLQLHQRNTINGVELQMWLYKNIRGFKDLIEVEIYATHLISNSYLIPYSTLIPAASSEGGQYLTFNRRENYIVSTRPITPALRSSTPTRSIQSRSTNLTTVPSNSTGTSPSFSNNHRVIPAAKSYTRQQYENSAENKTRCNSTSLRPYETTATDKLQQLRNRLSTTTCNVGRY